MGGPKNWIVVLREHGWVPGNFHLRNYFLLLPDEAFCIGDLFHEFTDFRKEGIFCCLSGILSILDLFLMFHDPVSHVFEFFLHFVGMFIFIKIAIPALKFSLCASIFFSLLVDVKFY